MLFQTGTFWISILAWSCFNEPIIGLELGAMFVCFGMMLTITLTSSGENEEVLADGTVQVIESNYTSQQLTLGYCLIFICAWTFAINCVMCRALSHINISVLMFWHGCVGLLMALLAIVGLGLAGSGFTIFSYDLQTYGFILVATLFDTLALNSQTIAFQ